jgi:hypothetical protein
MSTSELFAGLPKRSALEIDEEPCTTKDEFYILLSRNDFFKGMVSVQLHSILD